MPSRPPETAIYESEMNEDIRTLWRDGSRLYEDFMGPDESVWPDKKYKFVRVLSDVLLMLDPIHCPNCSTPVQNIALFQETHLQCPKCEWSPVTVTQSSLPADIFASQSVIDTLARVTAVLKDAIDGTGFSFNEDRLAAISDGKALLKVLRPEVQP